MNRTLHGIVLIIMVCLAATACGPLSSPPRPAAEEKTVIRYLTSNLDTEGTAKVITELAAEYSQAHRNVEYEYYYVGQSGLPQKVQLLAASNDLPTLFSFESGKPLRNLLNEVLDLETVFRELGIQDKLNPLAVKLLKEQTKSGGLYALPLELNVEGFWYNKEIFRQAGLQEPRTWEEMIAAADALLAKGIQPFSVAGKEKWPLTRYIGAYAIRKFGPDIMDRVENKEVRLTDPGFLEAAQMVYDMGKKGYFGPYVNTIDYESSMDLFLQGKAAMIYSGSWALRDFNNPRRNQIGSDRIGFFNIPLVKDGKGTLDEYAMNAGLTTSFSKKAYTPEVGKWMKSIFSVYGDRAMKDSGLITGFKVEHMPEEVPPLTKLVLEKIQAAKIGALWFEAHFEYKTQSAAWDNAQLLVNDSISPAQYMEELQRAVDNQK